MSTRRSVNRLQAFLWIFLLACFVPSAAGQSTSGSITGTVTDASGAVVASADVMVINQDTGVSQHMQGGTDGIYHAVDLVPGTYTLQVGAKGFSLLERKGIVLDANRVVNVDVKLTVGAASTKVEVSAVAPVINTESGSSNYVMTAELVEDTPLLMRQSHSNLGFAVYNPGANVGSSAEIMANGMRTLDGYSTTDGIVEMADPDGVGGGQISPDIDTIAEINYTIVDSPAEFKGPGNLTTVTKSGTNKLHGMGFYEYNSNAMNAGNTFTHTVPYHVYNDFVAELGGPIKKDNTFFFANYDQEHNRNQTVISNGNVPLAAWTQGNFSSLSTTLVNPFTRVAFPGNIITPSTLITSQGQNAVNYFWPAPNFGAPGLTSNNWQGNQAGLGLTKTLDGRVDHVFGPKDAVYGHYTYRHIHSNSTTAQLPPEGTGFQERDSTTTALSWTHTFTPTLLNQAVAGASRNSNVYHPNLIGSNILSTLGIPGVPVNGLHGVPYFTVNGGGTTLTSTAQTSDGESVDTDFHFSDNLSWIHGAHSVKWGFDAIRDYIPGFTYGNIYGTYSFTGAFSGIAVADLLMGLPKTAALSVPVPEQTLRGTMWSMYLQDSWKITPRLTANYGLRYELAGPYYDNFGRLVTFNPLNGDIVIPNNGYSSVNPLYPNDIPIENATQAAYPPQSMLRFPTNNFYPRIGLAYKLTSDGKTAIRAAYGIYGDTIYGALAQDTDQFFGGGPFAGSETLTNPVNTAATVAKPYVPSFTLANPFTSGATGTYGALQNVGGVNPRIGVPYLQQWNITLERQIGTMGVSIAYVGSHAVKLLYQRNLNEPAPSTTPYGTGSQVYNYTSINKNLNTITYIDNGATQNYNALQVAAKKNLGNGLTFNTSFTWQRDLTNQQDSNWAFGQQLQNQYCLSCEYGNNNFTPQKRFLAVAVYSLPFGHGQSLGNNINKYANGVIGGWKLSNVITLQSGQYYTPSFSTYDPSNTNVIGGRPDVIPGVSVVPAGRTDNNWVNLAAFAIPGCPFTTPVCSSPTANIGRFGSAGINILEGPPIRDWDLAVMKDFHTGERFLWQVEVQGANVLNHPALAAPSGNISTANNGGAIISALNAAPLQGASATRTIYAMIKVMF
jgi:hypothetical protein